MRLSTLSLLVLGLALAAHAADTLWLDELEVKGIAQEWREARRKQSVEGNALRIGGQTFERGIGTHANSRWGLDLHGTASQFSALVGVDDEINGNPAASIEFQLVGDTRVLWKSGVMKAKQAALAVDVDVTGVQTLKLLVSDAGDGNSYDHADWAMAKVVYNGEKPAPRSYRPRAPYILTPTPPKTPRINGARVFGARPGNPFLFTIPATGARPMAFAAEGLPAGLVLDPATGRITGSVTTAGSYTTTLVARNALGEDRKELRIEIGETICLTPPLGWNSWNCWAGSVDAEKVLAAAKAMAESGLVNHGWTYINIDDAWQGERGGPFRAIQPNGKFPDMKGLADQVHGLGLKLGIYSTPWVTSYAGYIGGSSDDPTGAWTRIPDRREYSKGHRHGKTKFDTNDALQWAAWGIDYLKYDWHPIDVTNTAAMTVALRQSGRDIVYSLSNGARLNDAPALAPLANCWRTTGDIRDTWASMAGIGFAQDKWYPHASPGHWNDPDMLVVGLVGWGPRLHPSQLSADEQYTHISLWSLLAAPLLIGCDMSKLDDFTLSLLTNDEVLAVNQDPKGAQAQRVRQEGETEVWARTLADGSRAVGLFNRGLDPATVTVAWADLGLTGKQRVRDLWRQQDVAEAEEPYAAEVAPHGVALLRLVPGK